MRGICANDFHLSAFAPEWAHCDVGPYLYDGRLAGAWELVTHLYDVVPDAATITNIMRAPNHSKYWIVGGNEYDLREGNCFAQSAALARAQMDAVSDVEIGAKFILHLGSCAYDITQQNSWADNVWAYLPKAYKLGIAGFTRNFYAQHGRAIDDPKALTNAPLRKFAQEFRAWVDGFTKPREAWITEVGLAAYGVAITDPRAVTYPERVARVFDANGIDRWAWYSLAPHNTAGAYLCLTELDGTLTKLGETWNETWQMTTN